MKTGSIMVNEKLGEISLRPIRQEDDKELGEIIRGCFLDYEATQTGTVFSDPIIDRMSHSYTMERSGYFILEVDGQMVGGAGIQPLKEAARELCELQKMYLKKDARGKGLGRTLLGTCLEFAKSEGFEICYLESLPELKDALRMYERAGFKYIEKRLGNTGYYGCSLFMTMQL